MQNVFVRVIVAVVTAALTWIVLVWGLEYFDSARPVYIATIILGSVILHEIGHMVAFKRHGVSSFMFFAVIMGGVSPLGEAYKTLKSSANVEIALAGVVGNIAAALIGVLLWQLGVLTMNEGLGIVNLNAGLMAFNLIPMKFLDGGRVASILFDSIEEDRDGLYVHCMVGVVAVAVVITIFFGKSQFVPAILFVLSLRKRAEDDDPEGSTKPGALNKQQQCFWARTFVFLAAASFIMASVTPHAF